MNAEKLASRKEMIRNRWTNRLKMGFVFSTGLLPVTQGEINSEVDSAQIANTHESIVDEEIDGVTSELKFDESDKPDSDTDILLSTHEKRAIRRDVNTRKFRQHLGSQSRLLLLT